MLALGRYPFQDAVTDHLRPSLRLPGGQYPFTRQTLISLSLNHLDYQPGIRTSATGPISSSVVFIALTCPSICTVLL